MKLTEDQIRKMINEEIRHSTRVTVTVPLDDTSRRFSEWVRAERSKGVFQENAPPPETNGHGSANAGERGAPLPPTEREKNESVNDDIRSHAGRVRGKD